jgi:hypothetical protein
MKTTSKLGILFLAFALMACRKETNEINEEIDNYGSAIDVVKVAYGMIQSPQWLVDEVNRIADLYSPTPHTGEKLYPWVYVVTHRGQDYIYVMDGVNSCYVCGNLYFTLSGKPVEPQPDIMSGLYGELEEVRWKDGIGHAGEFNLLWRYKYKSTKSRSTRAGQISFYTPNGTSVPDVWIIDEWYNTPARITYGRNSYGLYYPNAEEVSPPSTTYNCHGYAWSITEGGSPVWIGAYSPGQTNLFVDDGSYVPTPPNTPDAKVRYLNADHSAIAETADVFVSKWNEYPLYRHHKNYSPFGSSPQLAYYVRVAVPNFTVAVAWPPTSATYSVTNPIPGVKYEWELNGTIYTHPIFG